MSAVYSIIAVPRGESHYTIAVFQYQQKEYGIVEKFDCVPKEEVEQKKEDLRNKYSVLPSLPLGIMQI